MALSDPIADMLTRIRNGQQVNLATVSCPASKVKKGILEVLKSEGFIKDFNEVEIRAGISDINIALRYFEGKPVIKQIKRVSKPGLRKYSSIEDLGKVYNGLGVSIVSTSRGVMADHEARSANIGGEIICNVF
jgi:small subunit ribosomal protein S8